MTRSDPGGPRSDPEGTRRHVNGTRIGKPVDGFNADTVVSTGAIDLGAANLKKGVNSLVVELVGTNRMSARAD